MHRHESTLGRLAERPVLRFTLGVDAEEREPIIRDCSGAVSTELGYDPEDLLGRRLAVLYDGDQSVDEGGRVRLRAADGGPVTAVGAADNAGDQLRVLFIPEPRQEGTVESPATAAARSADHLNQRGSPAVVGLRPTARGVSDATLFTAGGNRVSSENQTTLNPSANSPNLYNYKATRGI